jgi:hypothetical protein
MTLLSDWMSPGGMWGERASLAALLAVTLVGPLRAGDEKPVFDPSDPTAAASHIEAMPEYNHADDYAASLLRVVYDLDWGEGKYSVTAEVPFGKADFNDDSETGLGDIRLRYFHRAYAAADPTDRLQNVVLSLDVFAPTGDSDRGLGLGTWLIAPTVILNVPLSERWSLFPLAQVKLSTGKTTGRSSPFPPGKNPTPGRETEDYIQAFQVEAYFTYSAAGGLWFLNDTNNEWVLLPEPGEDNNEMSHKGQVGQMFGRWGLGAETTVFLAGEKSQDYQVRGIFFYFF